jgi:hypothetical protein
MSRRRLLREEQVKKITWRKKHGPWAKAHIVDVELKDGRYEFLCGRTSPDWDAELKEDEGSGLCARCEKARDKAEEKARLIRDTDERSEYKEIDKPEHFSPEKLCRGCEYAWKMNRVGIMWFCKSGVRNEGCSKVFSIDKVEWNDDGTVTYYRRTSA